jgi:hypothetical protein
MIKQKWFNIAESHKEALSFHDSLDARMTPKERLSDITFCRMQYFMFNGMNPESMALKKVYKVFKRK